MNISGNEVAIIGAREWAAAVPSASVIAPAGAVVIPKRGGAIAINKKRVLSQLAALNPNLMAISPNPSVELASQRQWFESIDLATLSNGSAVPQLNKKDLSPLRFPVSSSASQKRFAVHAGRITDMGACGKVATAVADELFSSLVNRAFSGALTP